MAARHIRQSLDEDLQAYLDGEIDPERESEVEAALREDPHVRERLRRYCQIDQALKDALTPLADAPWSRRVTDALAEGKRRRMDRRFVRIAAAAAVTFVVGAGVGWEVRDYSTVPDANGTTEHIMAKASEAHNVTMRSAARPPASNIQHVVNRLSKTLGKPIRTPDLSDFGYALKSAKLLGDSPPAVQLVYGNEDGRRLTCYIRTVSGLDETGFRVEQRGNLSMFYWVDNDLGHALVGNVDQSQLLRLADKIYHHLNSSSDQESRPRDQRLP